MPNTLGELLCLLLPWHRWQFVRRLSPFADLHECRRCKRAWATLRENGITVPYYFVQYMYERNAPPPRNEGERE